MSFIYDDLQLIDQLVKAAQPAPATSAPKPEDNKQFLDLAKKLVKNLQSQMSGTAVFTAERDDAAVRTTHLQNLSSLLNFLSFNGIKYNGSQIVIPNRYENIRNTPEGKAYYTQLQQKGYFEYPANSDKPQYYILKDGLIAYLRDLQGKSNPVLNAMISKLIDQINSELQLEISKEPEKVPNLKMTVTTHPNGAAPAAPASPEITALQLLNQAVEELPFDTQDIDFNRINKFFDTYRKLISGPNVQENRKAPVLQAMQQAQDSMKNAQSTTQIVRTNFPMYNLTPNMVQSWLKPPQGQYYDSLLQALLGVVNNTEYVVRDLYNAYARRPSSTSRVTLNSEQENLVQQQIVGNSKYRSNFNAIRQMASRLGEVKQGK